MSSKAKMTLESYLMVSWLSRSCKKRAVLNFLSLLLFYLWLLVMVAKFDCSMMTTSLLIMSPSLLGQILEMSNSMILHTWKDQRAC